MPGLSKGDVLVQEYSQKGLRSKTRVYFTIYKKNCSMFLLQLHSKFPLSLGLEQVVPALGKGYSQILYTKPAYFDMIGIVDTKGLK